MPKLTLADLTPEPTTFEIAGHTYTVQTMTRAVETKHDTALKAFQESDEEDSVKNVTLLAKTIETLFDKPEGAPLFSKALVDEWKRDGIALGQIHGLYEGAMEAALARPTSRRRS